MRSTGERHRALGRIELDRGRPPAAEVRIAATPCCRSRRTRPATPGPSASPVRVPPASPCTGTAAVGSSTPELASRAWLSQTRRPLDGTPARAGVGDQGPRRRSRHLARRAGDARRGWGAEHGDRRRDDAGLALPDRLDHQGLDRDDGHAAGRGGPAVARLDGRRRAAGCPARRRGLERGGDGPAPADPHQRDRRRHLHRHRPRRRLRRAVRRPAGRRRAELPARARRTPTATAGSRSWAG